MSVWLAYNTDFLGFHEILRDGHIKSADRENLIWLNEIHEHEEERQTPEQLEFDFGEPYNSDRKAYDPTQLDYGVWFNADQIKAERWIDMPEQLELDLRPVQGRFDDPVPMLDTDYLDDPEVCWDCKTDYVANWWVTREPLSLECASGFILPKGTSDEEFDYICKAAGAMIMGRPMGGLK